MTAQSSLLLNSPTKLVLFIDVYKMRKWARIAPCLIPYKKELRCNVNN